MYEMDEGDDWRNEANWEKANPSLGISPSLEYLREQFTQAEAMGGTTEVEFKTKHLNLQVSSSDVWIQDKVWMQGESDLEFDPMEPIWAGLDLASVSDLTALVLAQPHNGGYIVRGHYFLPQDKMDEMKERGGNAYMTFENLPNVHVTEGNVTDYDEIRRVITGVQMQVGGAVIDENSLMHTLNIRKIAFDRYNATQIGIDLVNDGVDIAPFGQGFVSMSAPTKQLEILARQGKIYHDGDPVLRWAVSNVELRTDPAGNIKADKGHSADKIDPVVALVMAIGEHLKSAPDADYELEIISL
jgi:phage terminase large subunit-like protein